MATTTTKARDHHRRLLHQHRPSAAGSSLPLSPHPTHHVDSHLREFSLARSHGVPRALQIDQRALDHLVHAHERRWMFGWTRDPHGRTRPARVESVRQSVTQKRSGWNAGMLGNARLRRSRTVRAEALP